MLENTNIRVNNELLWIALNEKLQYDETLTVLDKYYEEILQCSDKQKLLFQLLSTSTKTMKKVYSKFRFKENFEAHLNQILKNHVKQFKTNDQYGNHPSFISFHLLFTLYYHNF